MAFSDTLDVEDSVIESPVDASSSRTARQALWFGIHTLLCLLVWGGTMAIATMLHPELDPPLVTLIPLAISFFFPLLFGLVANSIRPSEAASLVWFGGIIWILLLGLWILDMRTGPDACYHCGPGDKLWLTFFSPDQDSNLLDGQGRFLGTWPAAAMLGYGFGARLALHGKNPAQLRS